MTPIELRSLANSLDAKALRLRERAVELWGLGCLDLAEAAERLAERTEDEAVILRIRAAEVEARAMAMRQLFEVIA